MNILYLSNTITALVVFVIFKIYYRRLNVELHRLKHEAFQRLAKEKATAKITPSSSQRVSYQKRKEPTLMQDPTKRKSLQPGNILNTKEVKTKTMADVKNFDHKFFGTVLELDGRTLVDSLPKKLHLLECVDGITYIDGQQVNIHPDDMLRLVRSIE